MSDAGKRISPNINEQCFLIEKAESIINSTGGHVLKTKSTVYGKKNRPIRQLGENELEKFNTNLDYINFITKAQNSKNFFEISSAEEAQLAHYASITILKKPTKGRPTKTPVFTEAAFRDGINSDIFKTTGQRTGAGIVSLDITHEGIDSATEKIALVNAKFLFQDIRTMLSSPYVELFKVGAKEVSAKGTVFRTIQFELGWKASSALAARLNLDKMRLKLKTHLVKYTFDLSQDGSITVNAQYRGRLVDIYNGPDSNIVALAKGKFDDIKNNLAALETQAIQNANSAVRKAEAAQQKAIAISLVNKIMNQKAEDILYRTDTYADPNKAQFKKVLIGGRTWMDAMSTSAFTKVAGTVGSLAHQKKKVREVIGQAFDIIEKKAIALTEVEGFSGTGPAMREQIKAQINALESAWKKQVLTGRSGTEVQGLSDSEVRKILTGTDAEFMRGAKLDANGNVVLKTPLSELEKKLNDAKKAADEATQNAERDLRRAVENAEQQLLVQAMLAKYLALQEIGKSLFKEEKIATGYIPKETAQRYRKAVGERNPSGIRGAVDDVKMSDFFPSGGRLLTLEQLSTEEYQPVPFMYLGHLLETILELPTDIDSSGKPTGTIYELLKRNSGEEPKVDFGYVSYRRPFSGEYVDSFPLYYLPISLTKINNFFAREVVAKELDFYSFKNFLSSLLKSFFTNMFGVCAADSNNVVNFNSPKLQRMVGQDKKDVNYFIYGSKSISTDIKKGRIRFGNYSENYRNKIYHFFFGGQAKGAVLNVKVTDVADDASKTAIYYSNRASGVAQSNLGRKTTLMPAVFQADIQTIGFPLFNLGQIIYVDLKPYITDKNDRLFKANGYYGIYKISHNFSPNSFTSNVSAIIQYSKADKGKTNASVVPVGKPHKSQKINISAQVAKIAALNAAAKTNNDYLKTGKINGKVPANLSAASIWEKDQASQASKARQRLEADSSFNQNSAEWQEGYFLHEYGPKWYEYAYGLDSTDKKMAWNTIEKRVKDYLGTKTSNPANVNALYKKWLGRLERLGKSKTGGGGFNLKEYTDQTGQ